MSASKWKPYQKYRKTDLPWIGEIPSHWQTISVKHLFQLGRGRVISSGEIQDNQGEYPVYSSQTSNEGIMGHINTFDFEGDYLTWTTDGAHAGTVFSRSGRFNCTNVCGTLLPHVSENLDLNYMQKCINSLTKWYVRHDINPKLMNDTMGSITIPLPPIEEQKSIGQLFEREDEVVNNTIAILAKILQTLEEKRSTLITQVLTKGLNSDVQMKESGVEWFGKIPNHWELHRLGRISEKITDIDHKMPTAQEEGIPFISAKDLMDDGSINFGPNVKKISQEDYENLSRKIVPKKNDIIYSRIGTVGKARLVQSDVKFLASYSCCFIRLNQDLALPKYITFLLDNEITLIDAKLKSTGIGQPDLALKEINHFKIPLPPMDEQEEISTYLEKQIFCYNQLRDRLAESIDKLVEYRSSLISAAVTGKIDVRSL